MSSQHEVLQVLDTVQTVQVVSGTRENLGGIKILKTKTEVWRQCAWKTRACPMCMEFQVEIRDWRDVN